MSQDNIIYIGRKPAMSYVMATLATFNNNETVHLKARGRAITTAVDVAEITRNRYMTEMEHPVITEQVEDDRGTRNVSTMTIVMNKGDAVVPQDAFERRPRRQPRERHEEPKMEEAEEPVESMEEESEEQDVSTIKGVGNATEEKLRAAGYDTVAKIVKAESFELALKTGLSEKQVSKIIDAAREL